MVIPCIWPFKGATVNIGYCSGYCKIFGTGLFAHCSYECLPGKGATNWSNLLLIDFWPLYSWMYWPFSIQEPSSQGVTPCCGCVWIFLSDWLAFPKCGLCMNVLNVSLSWPFLAFLHSCRSQCESSNILMFLFSCNYQILYRICHFYCFSSV